MPPKRSERVKKPRKAKANGAATLQQAAAPAVSRRSPPPRRAKNGKGRQTRSNKPSNTTNNKQLGKRKTKKTDPIIYTSDEDVQYRIGDFAYVDAEKPELPYHICRIRDFKTTRKEHVVADVTWFYRPSEVPESIYLHLLDDQQSEHGEIFKDRRIRERQLFISLSCADLRPLEASLFRGKCKVFRLTEDKQLDLGTLIETPDQFFYSLAYNQEARQFTFVEKEGNLSAPYIPYSQQAVLPEFRPFPCQDESEKEASSNLVWEPKIDDNKLLTVLKAARSIALHAGLLMGGSVQYGYMAASSDETTQTVFDTIHNNHYDTEVALKELVKKPTANKIVAKKKWSPNDSKLFAQGVKQYGKHFSRIQKEYLPNKSVCNLIEHYYYWKKDLAGLETRNLRRQKKQHHIKTTRLYYKLHDTCQEFAELGSADEDDGSDESDKDTGYHVCGHCCVKESTSWHHAGPNNCLVCNICRLYFNKYGEMRPLKESTGPPMAHPQVPQTTAQMDEESVLTSKVRQGVTKKSPSPENGGGPTLRSGRIYKTSETSEDSTDEDYEESGDDDETQEIGDDQEEVEESDCSEDSYSNSRPALIKKQTSRASLLVHLREKETESVDQPPLKKAKMDSTSHSSGQRIAQGECSLSSSASPNGTVTDGADLLETSSSHHTLAPDPLRNLSLPLIRTDYSGCARSDIIYNQAPKLSKKKNNETSAESDRIQASSSSSSVRPSSLSKGPQTSQPTTPSMQQYTPLISVYTPTVGSFPGGTPFSYPPAVGEAQHTHEQAVAMATAAAAMGHYPFHWGGMDQERAAELQRMMYYKQQQQQQQQQQVMEAGGHMTSPPMMQHPYLPGMVMCQPEMLAAAAVVAGGNGGSEDMLIRQRIAAAAVSQQIPLPHTPSGVEMNHFQFDPRALMQYGNMSAAAVAAAQQQHTQEDAMMQIRTMEMKLVQFAQHLLNLCHSGLISTQLLAPEFIADLKRHYELFKYLLQQYPANQHNANYQQIGNIIEQVVRQQILFEQQHRAAAMDHPAVRTGVIVNSAH